MEKANSVKTLPMLEYSIVIPIYNEAENILSLFHEIETVMNQLGSSWELLFVDDGSTDASSSIIETLSGKDKKVRLIRLKKNAGQTAAFDAGFKHAKARFIITLDGDGQNVPSDIPKLISAIEEGYDLVAGKRQKRHDSFGKRLISRIANSFRQRLLQDGVQDTGCSLKLFRREMLEQIQLYKGMHRFFPALVLIAGGRVKEIEVTHRARNAGKSKYTFFNRGPSLISDMLAVAWMRKRHLQYDMYEVE